MKQATDGPAEAKSIEDYRRILLIAASRLEGLARRMRRNQDFLSEWTVRSVAWDLTMYANSPGMFSKAKREGRPR
jgi:hypothetical protein